MITYEEARELLDYDPYTGELRWKKYRAGNAKAGDVAGYKRFDGYIQVTINRTKYYAHHIAWLLHHGNWPEDQLDHKDHDPSNNKIENLRAASYSINLKNQALRCDNTSGTCGISWDTDRRKWTARIKVGPKYKFLGRFDDLEEAILMRMLANEKYGYHQNHGLMPTRR